MKKDEIDFLKNKIGQGNVDIFFSDGESMTARIISVSETEEDIICDVITTSMPEKYTGNDSTLFGLIF